MNLHFRSFIILTRSETILGDSPSTQQDDREPSSTGSHESDQHEDAESESQYEEQEKLLPKSQDGSRDEGAYERSRDISLSAVSRLPRFPVVEYHIMNLSHVLCPTFTFLLPFPFPLFFFTAFDKAYCHIS